jgi:hypothetical protein
MYDIEIASDRKGFETRNFLARLDARNKLEYFAELSQPVDWPPPLYQRVMGLEDCRLFAWRGEAWCVATVGELSADGVRRMVLARIDGAGSPNPVFADWRMLDAPVTGRHEKNWMPFVDGRELRFMGLQGIEWVILRDHSGGSMHERTLRRRYSSSRNP